MLRLVQQGASTLVIAQALGTSRGRARHYLSDIIRILQVHSRAAAIHQARTRGRL
ncbi:response regulator transcription factor [Deinococcus sp. 14RED07]|uniref:hypothetical protein n=1 Tax=unclassified Deinococcus TaxID=2623546 RepID=UPI00351CF44D|nr:response regulator transcription factor [Deinococcus sp. 12RED42]MCD0174602.1 response regulator transcription factor [Deinococcus sp. 14RED07]